MGIFEAKGLDFSQLPDADDLRDASGLGRGFAAAGGVAAAVEELLHREQPDAEIKIQCADGLRACRKLLTLAKAGKLDGYLLEGMACPGGCISGAGTIVSSDAARKQLDAHRQQADTQSCASGPYRAFAGLLDAPSAPR